MPRLDRASSREAVEHCAMIVGIRQPLDVRVEEVANRLALTSGQQMDVAVDDPPIGTRTPYD